MVQTEYRGFQIRLEESTEEWIVEETDIKEYGLKGAKKQIDKLIKEKVVGKKALRIDYTQKWESVDVTNAARDEKNYFWILSSTGWRGKVSTDNLFQDNSYNRKRLEVMFQLKKQRSELETEYNILRKKLKKF